ncbi:hypothetical protein RJ640_009328 [Escallonia rubra]|uniref:CCHC-type domain-containing protein n=1 Tax=Escallonia rubra TaxID=112253 RepID=A0AA88SAB9_9ASTE|nr:hypothetical protein RJ640_009328 [Escallonia rubra]
MDAVLGELLREETRIATQATLERKTKLDSVFIAKQNMGKWSASQPKNLSKVQCFECKEFGHVVSHCKKKNSCVYCKQAGHIVTECPEVPQKDVPKLATNLISVGQLVDVDNIVSFSRDGCMIQDRRTGKMKGKGRRIGRLFALEFEKPGSYSSFFAPSDSDFSFSSKTWHIWHRRLGHPSPQKLEALFSSRLLTTKPVSLSNVNKSCVDYYSRFHVFGCVCFVHLPALERTKFSKQAAMCVFVGYSADQKGFLCYDPLIRRVRISRHVIFMENVPYYHAIAKSTNSQLSFLPDFSDSIDASSAPCRNLTSTTDDTTKPLLVYERRSKRDQPPAPLIHQPEPVPSFSQVSSFVNPSDLPNLIPSEDVIPLRRSNRTTRPPDRLSLFAHHHSLFSSLDSIDVPTSYQQAAIVPCWKEAMDAEINALLMNDTWDLVPSPPNASIIGSRWVFSVKLKSDGSIERGLLQDLQINLVTPTPLYADNTSAIRIASNPIFHERTKHIEVDCHFIRDKYLDGVISLPYVASQDQIADIFTKPITPARHDYLVDKLLLSSPPQFEGECSSSMFNWGISIKMKSDKILKLLEDRLFFKEERARARKLTSGIKGFGTFCHKSPKADGSLEEATFGTYKRYNSTCNDSRIQEEEDIASTKGLFEGKIGKTQQIYEQDHPFCDDEHQTKASLLS